MKAIWLLGAGRREIHNSTLGTVVNDTRVREAWLSKMDEFSEKFRKEGEGAKTKKTLIQINGNNSINIQKFVQKQGIIKSFALVCNLTNITFALLIKQS